MNGKTVHHRTVFFLCKLVVKRLLEEQDIMLLSKGWRI